MGLDQYAYARRQQFTKPVDFNDEINKSEQSVEVAYWRKHPNLHGWMHKLYLEKGGQDDSFNCNPVVITLEDLAVLESDVLTDSLPTTSGFFFGQSYPEDKETDLAFIKKARELINDGMTVWYDSWW